jgi:hypothetical protein
MEKRLFPRDLGDLNPWKDGNSIKILYLFFLMSRLMAIFLSIWFV